MNQTAWLFFSGQAIGIAAVMISIYVKVSVKLRELEIRVRGVENQDNTILKKLDELKEQITGLKIEMQNKENRT